MARNARKNRAGRQRGAAASTASSKKPQNPAPNHMDTLPSPRDESSPVRTGPTRAHNGPFRKVNDPGSEVESSPSQSSASTIDDDSEDENLGNHESTLDDHMFEKHNRAKHIRILSVTDSETITVEELNTEDMFDFTNVLMPSRIQDASSDDSDVSDSDSRSSLADDFENLQCGSDLTEEDFERWYRRKSLQRRSKWRKGGNHKRHHDQTVGSGEEFEDVTPLDPPTSNPSRRLRRRTGEPQEKPGREQIIGNVEELFGTVSNVIIEANVSGDYDEYFLSQWTFDSMVIDEDDSSDGEASNEESSEESSEDSSEDSSNDSSDEEVSDSDDE
jgi:hypothetical protein